MSKGHGVGRSKLLMVLVAASAMAGPIAAATAKVYVDPDGPAGQEYALPLDSARGEAAGTPDAGVPGSSASPPLFGHGIGPSEPPGKPGRGADKAGEKQPLAPAKARDTGIAAAGEDSSTTLQIGGVIGAVVLLGTAAGLIVRHRFPPAPQG
jgi:hypothetical protein